MGGSSFSKHDLEMIEISWIFLKDKQLLGLKTMVKYIIFYFKKGIDKFIYIFFKQFIHLEYLIYQKILKKCFYLQAV
jgi:hypothetical protein